MQEKQIPVVSHQEFQRLAERDPCLLHKHPWVVTGYIERWPRFRQWQDLDYLEARFGHLRAFAKAPNFVTNRRASLVSVETTFSQYLDYIRNPERVEHIYAGCWKDGTYEDFVAQGLPLYCGTLRMVHQAGDAIFEEVNPLVPAPLETWNHALPYYYTLFNHFWLLVGLPGALTPLHVDNNATIALIAQLRGKKKATLYSPDDLRHVYSPGTGFMDPVRPDEAEYPTWNAAVPWTCVLDAGQVLFVGTEWAHHVETLETSISVSFDFVNESNISAYAAAVQWATALGDRIKRNPRLVENRMGGVFNTAGIRELPAVSVGRCAMAEVLRASLAEPRASSRTSCIRGIYLGHLERCMARDASYEVDSHPPGGAG